MKRILFVLLVLGAAMSSKAQHALQIDDAAGRYGIIQSNPLWPIGTTVFQLPPTGGTLIVAPPPGTPALVWLTDATGNTLTGGSSTTTNERFGSFNNYDVIMMANNAEKMRLIAGGGVSFTNAALGINGLSYNWPAIHGAGIRVLSNDGAGNLSWTTGYVTSVAGTANQVLVNGGTAAQTGAVTLSAPQNIHTGASPVFVGMQLTGLTASRNVRTDASSNLTTGAINLAGGVNEVTGVLPIANGGTNSGTALNNNRIMVSSGGAIVEAAALTNGQLLIGSTGVAPVAATLTGTANQVNVVTGAGSITLSTPQNIHTGASPTFVGATLTGIGGLGVVHSSAGGVLSSSPVVLTSEVSGVLPIANGGTNSGTALAGSSIMISNGTQIVQGPAGTTTTVLHGNAGGAPTYGAVSLTADVSGVLPIANGGTNSGTALNNNRIMVSSGGAIVEAAALTNGQLLIGSTGVAPVAAAITGTANRVTVTNGAGTITLSGPQDIHTGASPTFVGATLTGLTASRIVRTTAGSALTTGAVALNGGATEVTGVLPIANGGTNSGTALNNNRIMVSSGGAIVEAAALTNGQLLIGSTGVAPVAATLTGTANQVNVVTGAGSITLSTPQNIHTGASPTFVGMNLSGLTANRFVRTDGSNNLVSAATVNLTGASEVTGVLPVANGGTGLNASTVTAGQILIGHDANNNFSLATITAGSGINVTNGDGTITISATATGTTGNAAFMTAGAHAWIVPVGVTAVKVVMFGAGGGGGGGGRDQEVGGSQGGSGQGGGGGAYLDGIIAVTAGETLTINVGTGGTAGTASTNVSPDGGNGGNGGQSDIDGSVSGANIVVAVGGEGGEGGERSSIGGDGGSANGAGGAATDQPYSHTSGGADGTSGGNDGGAIGTNPENGGDGGIGGVGSGTNGAAGVAGTAGRVFISW
jgi:hypothetical protein